MTGFGRAGGTRLRVRSAENRSVGCITGPDSPPSPEQVAGTPATPSTCHDFSGPIGHFGSPCPASAAAAGRAAGRITRPRQSPGSAFSESSDMRRTMATLHPKPQSPASVVSLSNGGLADGGIGKQRCTETVEA
ncbi:hypothetical protein GCM10028775_72440 [Catellatospora paridis]